jgi:hypothetical protein
MGFQTRKGLNFFLQNIWDKILTRVQLYFYPILFVIAFKFVNYIMKLVHQVFSKGENRHLGQTNKKVLTLMATCWKKGLFQAYLSTLSLSSMMVYLFT